MTVPQGVSYFNSGFDFGKIDTLDAELLKKHSNVLAQRAFTTINDFREANSQQLKGGDKIGIKVGKTAGPRQLFSQVFKNKATTDERFVYQAMRVLHEVTTSNGIANDFQAAGMDADSLAYIYVRRLLDILQEMAKQDGQQFTLIEDSDPPESERAPASSAIYLGLALPKATFSLGVSFAKPPRLDFGGKIDMLNAGVLNNHLEKLRDRTFSTIANFLQVFREQLNGQEIRVRVGKTGIEKQPSEFDVENHETWGKSVGFSGPFACYNNSYNNTSVNGINTPFTFKAMRVLHWVADGDIDPTLRAQGIDADALVSIYVKRLEELLQGKQNTPNSGFKTVTSSDPSETLKKNPGSAIYLAIAVPDDSDAAKLGCKR